ncbi:glycoside hydrolase family 1 protein [Gloeothece verrucosa]|uniref:Glycoside hydrolase family 1 n=1 Tax=Gloeothece verrucosa (strain PCC 7822) TaxID=497965 RepID=E0UB97_GLOV7|nr:family 1 glycosylhydrolase [Gloeothece verrucosa]ADN17453.1 glycoside hydrolase family 1 [Gloeothece verrucosa PCC 7822]
MLTSIETQPFLWGVATSAYQSEGGYNGIDQPKNNWYESEHKGRVMVTGQAADFWTRYEEDFKTCQQMGLNSFRIGIEWARIQPSTVAKRSQAPDFDQQAINTYAKIIATCRHYGLEPIVTLHHFTHPAWLGLDAWLSQRTIDHFINFVQVSITEINRLLIDHYQVSPIHLFITINEPNILVTNSFLRADFPAKTRGIKAVLKAYNNILLAHVRAYNSIHNIYQSQGWPTPQVSLNTYCSDLYWLEKVIWDLLSVKKNQIKLAELKDYFDSQAQDLEISLSKAKLPFRRDLPYYLGRLVRRAAKSLGYYLFDPKYFKTLLVELEKSPYPDVFDYLAIDYYDPFIAHTFRLPFFSDFEFQTKDFRGWLMSGITSKWWDWRSLPEGLHFFCKYYSEQYKNKPILIAENGMALRRKFDNSIATKRPDQMSRSEFIKIHLEQVKRLFDEGVSLMGYIHWSLTDNYEWGSYTPRFGLFSLDFMEGTKRLEVDHLGDRPSQTYAELIQKAKQALKNQDRI